MMNISTLSDFLKSYRPRKILFRKSFTRSSVAIVLMDDNCSKEINMLMIKRAKRKGDPWSGDMGFPGGMFSSENDKKIHDTAVRELFEETGLKKDGLEYIGRLSELLTKTHEKVLPMIITPFVFKMNGKVEWKKSSEVEELVWIPLSYFFYNENRVSVKIRKSKFALSFPCYNYYGRCVWGLSLFMIDELTNIRAHIEKGTPIKRSMFIPPKVVLS
jgi:8-oxo-dGTP pyrophosphatase MutT (NUDIX family)